MGRPAYSFGNGGGRTTSDRLQTARGGKRTSSPAAVLDEISHARQKESSDDTRIRHLVQQQLAKFGPQIEDHVTFSVRNGRVVLSGHVESAYERQMILHEIGRLAYVKHVRCGLRTGADVADEGEPSSWFLRPELVTMLAVLSVVAMTWGIWIWWQQH